MKLVGRKLENWEDAATDAEIAQEIEPRNVKVCFSIWACESSRQIGCVNSYTTTSRFHPEKMCCELAAFDVLVLLRLTTTER